MDFACKKYKRKVDVDSKKDIIVLEGAGLGIWEDNISSLYALFSGKISHLLDEEDEENRIYFPLNFAIYKVGDFDLLLDIKGLNQDINMHYKKMVKHFLNKGNEFIKENNIVTSDCD